MGPIFWWGARSCACGVKYSSTTKYYVDFCWIKFCRQAALFVRSRGSTVYCHPSVRRFNKTQFRFRVPRNRTRTYYASFGTDSSIGGGNPFTDFVSHLPPSLYYGRESSSQYGQVCQRRKTLTIKRFLAIKRTLKVPLFQLDFQWNFPSLHV